MPWHQEPMKDVTSCDKPRGAANKRDIRGFPNGETPMVKNHGTYTEYIGIRGEPGELKHLSTRRKRNQTRFRESWRAKVEEAKPIVEIWSGFGLRREIVEL